jgi:hypothetical protein
MPKLVEEFQDIHDAIYRQKSMKKWYRSWIWMI